MIIVRSQRRLMFSSYEKSPLSLRWYRGISMSVATRYVVPKTAASAMLR